MEFILHPGGWSCCLYRSSTLRICMVETSLSSNHAHSHLLKLQKGISLNHIPIPLTIRQYYRCGSTMLLYRERKSRSSKTKLALPRTSSNWRILVPTCPMWPPHLRLASIQMPKTFCPPPFCSPLNISLPVGTSVSGGLDLTKSIYSIFLRS
jgi:hypothetical protein